LRVRILFTVLAAIAAIGLVLWFGWGRFSHRIQQVVTAEIAPVSVTVEHIDAANEGRNVHISGKLEIAKPPRDTQLGVGADAAVLFRKVEMMQWQENCGATDCTYTSAWSATPADSSKFRHPAGHENPPQRLANARFDAGEIRLGAYMVDAELAATQLKAIDYPAHAANLPPNMAASFSEVGGVLYAGGDPAQPRVGTVRVSYRIVPIGSATLTGVQTGTRLIAH
jgi:hypothetical protein